MRRSKKFTSMPVISLEEGRQIGTVKGLLLDPAGKRVAALIIEQRGWFKEQRFVPYHKVHSVGENAITVEKSSRAEKAANLPEIVRLLKEKVNLLGVRIVAENGTLLGFVDEYYVDETSGTITGLEFSGRLLDSVIKGRAFLDMAYVRTIGKEVIVITNEGVENVFKLDGGLQETFKGIVESTGQFWENTVQKTKEISANINKSLEKVKREKRSGAQETQLSKSEKTEQEQTDQIEENIQKGEEVPPKE